MIPAEAVEAAGRFLDRYAARSGLTRDQILERRVIATCECGEEICEGFQCMPEDTLLPWRGETVLIRKPHDAR